MNTLKSLALAGLMAIASTAAWAEDFTADYERAIVQDNPSRISGLLRDGMDPNLRNSRGVPGLVMATQQESWKAAEAILASKRVNLEATTENDENALMLAALKGQVDIVRAMLAKGAKVNKPGWSPLHYAATGGNTEVIELLLKRGADIEARSPNESTPLMMAARYGSIEGMQVLLRAGADPRARNQLAMDALDFAASANRPDAMELLTEAKRRAPVRASSPAQPAPGVAEQITPAPSPAVVARPPEPAKPKSPAAVTSSGGTPFTTGEGAVLNLGSPEPGQ